MTMVEVMEVIICTEWDHLNRSPAEIIPTMSIMSIIHPQNHPSRYNTDMNLSKDKTSQGEIYF